MSDPEHREAKGEHGQRASRGVHVGVANIENSKKEEMEKHKSRENHSHMTAIIKHNSFMQCLVAPLPPLRYKTFPELARANMNVFSDYAAGLHANNAKSIVIITSHPAEFAVECFVEAGEHLGDLLRGYIETGPFTPHTRDSHPYTPG